MKRNLLLTVIILIALFIGISSIASAADLYTIKQITVVGNDKVKEQVILNLLPFREGDQFTKDAMKEKATYATRILRDEKIFFTVNVFPFFSDESMECKIVVDINGEWTYQFAFDVNPLYIGLEERALLGKNDSLGIKLSKIKQEVYFTDRRAFNQPLNISAGVYNQTKITMPAYSKDENGLPDKLGYFSYSGFGGYLSVLYKLDDHHQIDGGVKFVKDRLKSNLLDPDPALDEKMGFFNQDQLTLSAGYKFTTRTWKSYNGLTFDITGGATKLLNEDLLYAKGIISLRGYQTLFSGLHGAVKFEYGMCTDNTPYYKQFNLNSINGVRSSEFIVPGTQELLFKSEVSYPIFAGLQGVAFLDAGTSWNKGDSGQFEKLGVGYGIGLRYFAGMPVNTTFRLEWAVSKGRSGVYFVTGESF